MDASIYSRSDIHSKTQLRFMAECRENKDPKSVLLRGFLGGTDGRQVQFISTAINRAKSHYATQGINLIADMYTNDIIKNTHHWSPQQCIDRLIKADCHLIGAPFYEGNIADTADWNVKNIDNSLDRLEYHCGFPMGGKIFSPDIRGDKYRTYEVLEELGQCLPTLKIDLPLEDWDEWEIDVESCVKIDSWVNHVESLEGIDNADKYIVKLPTSAGGFLGDKKSTKTCVGRIGILNAIREFLRNHPMVLGYIRYVMVQPYFPFSTEAKVICFNGECRTRNEHKKGNGKRSLGSDLSVLGSYAELICEALTDWCPEYIVDQVIRVDFFQHPVTKKYFVNEIESINAQIVGLDTTASIQQISFIERDLENYWYRVIRSMVDLHLRERYLHN